MHKALLEWHQGAYGCAIEKANDNGDRANRRVQLVFYKRTSKQDAIDLKTNEALKIKRSGVFLAPDALVLENCKESSAQWHTQKKAGPTAVSGTIGRAAK